MIKFNLNAVEINYRPCKQIEYFTKCSEYSHMSYQAMLKKKSLDYKHQSIKQCYKFNMKCDLCYVLAFALALGPSRLRLGPPGYH